MSQTQLKGSVTLASDAEATTTIGNATGNATVTNLISNKMNSTDATTNQTIGDNLTTGMLSLANGNLTTGSINMGRLLNTFANSSRVIMGTFKSIEQSIASEFESRVYKRVFGVHSATTQLTEQTCYATTTSLNPGVVKPIFQLDIPAGTSFTTQFFDITAVGWVDAIRTYVFNGSFVGGISNADTVCFTNGTNSNPFAFGPQFGSNETHWTFTLATNRITLNYTNSTSVSHITVKIVSNIGRPGQTPFLITPLC